METWDELKGLVENRSEQMKTDAEDFRKEMNEKIEAARNNEVLTFMKALNARLIEIELRLPPKEEE